MFAWLNGTNDKKLAETRYADRQSATDRAAARRRAKYHRNVAATDRKAAKWEEKERRRLGC